jgi:hypothetical protein
MEGVYFSSKEVIMFTKTQRRVIFTCLVTYLYCMIWMILEMIIDGVITNRAIDNIIMLLFIPIIWIASDKVCERKKKEKRNG